MSGLFITLEGTEGSGKSTVSNIIEQFLIENNRKVIKLRQPGGSLICEKIRDLVLNIHDEKLDDKAELFLMYASRVQLVQSIIKPKLAQGYDVICDRHDLSTFAYQGGARGIDLNLIKSLSKIALGDFKPDLTILLDIDPKLGMQRVAQRGNRLDRIEQEKIEFFNKVRDTYLKCAQEDNTVRIIDASDDLLSVKNKTLELIGQLLKC